MQSRAAIRYAKAMYDIAIEENFVNEVYKDMSLIKDLYCDSLDFKSLLSNSQINYHALSLSMASNIAINNKIPLAFFSLEMSSIHENIKTIRPLKDGVIADFDGIRFNFF